MTHLSLRTSYTVLILVTCLVVLFTLTAMPPANIPSLLWARSGRKLIAEGQPRNGDSRPLYTYQTGRCSVTVFLHMEPFEVKGKQERCSWLQCEAEWGRGANAQPQPEDAATSPASGVCGCKSSHLPHGF